MLPYLWRQILRWSRVALACGALADVLLGRRPVPVWLAIPYALYLCYALSAAMWRGLEDIGAALAAFGVDAIFMILSLWIGGTTGIWISALFFAYISGAAALLQGWWGVIIIAIPVILISISDAGVRDPARPIVYVTCAILAAGLALERQSLQRRVASLGRQSVHYRHQAEQARTHERQRIAGDFHDGPLQSFIGFQMQLEVIRRLLERDWSAAAQEVLQLQSAVAAQVNDLRTFVRNMRPPDIGESLAGSLSRIVEQFKKESGLAASFTCSDSTESPEQETTVELLQIAREALNNIRKHSAATRVSITLHQSEEALEMRIEDNGQGFPFCGEFDLDELELLRMGPVSIRRRVRALGGNLLLDSKPGRGSVLQIRILA